MIALESALFIAAIWWLAARAWSVLSKIGSRQRAKPWEQAFIDLTTPFWFGGMLLLMESAPISRFASGRILLWVAALTPFAIYFYLAWRFAAWRWRRRADRSQPLTFTLKPTTPVAWVVYIWFGVWVAWQLCHAFAPALLPHWLS